jgi:acetyl esterase/lipase
LLWIHGGCYVIGCADGMTTCASDLPEVLHWLARQADVDSSRIAIGGASAGGGLMAALALRLRDEGAAQQALQLLTYPMLDNRAAFKPDPEPKLRRLMGQGMNRFGWASYLRGVDRDAAAPARAVNFSGLPPGWIGVGTHDLLLDECLGYADRLKKSGVPCALEVVPGAFHVFDLVAPKGLVSQRFFEAQCRTLRGTLMDEG